MKPKHFLIANVLKCIPSTARRLQFCQELVEVLQSDNSRFCETTFRQQSNCCIDETGSWYHYAS